MTGTISAMNPALERFIAQFKATADAIIDSWFICDTERNIVEYNRASLKKSLRTVAKFAALEGLDAHGRSASIRVDSK